MQLEIQVNRIISSNEDHALIQMYASDGYLVAVLDIGSFSLSAIDGDDYAGNI